MAYFPFMIDIADRKCLVVGGGETAFHKVKILLGFDVRLFVISPSLDECFAHLEYQKGQILFLHRKFRDDDIDEMDFVIAATNDADVNLHISKLCRERAILVNVVDRQEACTFIFPALIQKENMLVAVSSGGQSPAAVSYLKDKIKEVIPGFYGKLAAELGAYRESVLREEIGKS